MFHRWLKEQDTSGRDDIQRMQADLAQCANWLLFRNYYRVDEIRLAAATTCKRHLVCPFCAARRGSKQVEKYTERLAQILKEQPHLKPVMLTLTVVNGEDLEERFNHLVNSFRKLQERRRDYLKKGRGYTEFSKAQGAVFSYEVTNKGNGWHPHLHAVLLLDDWIDNVKLSREWHAITGDSYIIDIRRLAKGTKDVLDRQGNIAPQIVEAFQEVFKYALKFSDLDFSSNLHAWETLRGKRLQGAFGAFWGVKVPETLMDDPIASEPFLELLYRFDGRAYQLTRYGEGKTSIISGKLQRSAGFMFTVPHTPRMARLLIQSKRVKANGHATGSGSVTGRSTGSGASPFSQGDRGPQGGQHGSCGVLQGVGSTARTDHRRDREQCHGQRSLFA